jgi:hypothetical protein
MPDPLLREVEPTGELYRDRDFAGTREVFPVVLKQKHLDVQLLHDRSHWSMKSSEG